MVVLMIAVVFVGGVGKRYYDWVTNTKTPYDEVGIDLHKYMPEPIQKWGCAKLQQNFGNSPPPHGCGDSTSPHKWRS